MPKVTVCIPTYNRSSYLSYSVQSVLNQTYNDFELIVCDDGSKDNTSEVIKNFNDPRIHYIQHPQNIGRSRNMRSGFEAATGEYFIKFDDDDALTPEFLTKTVTILDAHPTVDLVCTNHWVINQSGKRMESATQDNAARWGKDQLSEGIILDLLWQTYYYQSLQVGSTLFRRSCLAEVDYMSPQADGCEDFDLLVRLAIAGKQAYFLPEYLMEYRFHGGQNSLKQDLHFLRAKLFCVAGYNFTDTELEKERIKRLASLRETLGMRLLEQGDTQEGRKLLQQSTTVLGSSKRYQLGMLLSYLPVSWRQTILTIFRQTKAKDYTTQVRESV